MDIDLRLDNRRIRYTAFFLLAVAINAADTAIVRSVADPGKRMLISAAATIDLVVVVCAIYYRLLVRSGIRGRASLIAMALIGALRASVLYPNAKTLAEAGAAVCEAGLIAFVVVQVRRKTRRAPGQPAADPVDSIRVVLEGIFPPVAARAVAIELCIFYYALFAWRARLSVPSAVQPFSLHKKGGQADLLYIVACAGTMEIAPVHLLLRHWSHPAAWIATSLSVYGMIWLVGLARSIALRPVLVAPDHLDVRFGLLFRARVPRNLVAAVRPAERGDRASAALVPRRSEPNFCIELARPIDVEGPLGRRRTVTRIALAVDEGAEFANALQRFMAGS
jgi:hypothetical protein